MRFFKNAQKAYLDLNSRSRLTTPPPPSFLFSGCRYQFFQISRDVIPTIDLSRACANNKCSQPINAPFDKTKHTCHVSWVNYLENGTWRENPIRIFRQTFDLRSSDYFSEKGYMYSLEVRKDEYIQCGDLLW